MYRSQHLALKYLTAAIALFGVMTARRAYVGVLLHQSRFPVWAPSFQHCQNSSYRHAGDLASDGIYGIDLLVPAGGIRPRACRNPGGRDFVLCVLRGSCDRCRWCLSLFNTAAATKTALWLINQGRKYVEAPRWAAIGVVVVMVVFAYNVIGTAYATRRITGIIAVLMIDLVPLVVLYLDRIPCHHATCRRTCSGGGGSSISGSRRPGRS